MPTENRRVATYLPKEIDDRLKAFIAERELKGDSQALIVILSEFFGMSYKVGYSGELLVKKLEFEDGLRQLRSELLSRLSSELEVIKTVEVKIASLEAKIDSVQQVKETFLGISDSPLDNSIEPSELLNVVEPNNVDPVESLAHQQAIDSSIPLNDKLVGINATELAKRLKIGPSTISTRKQSSSDDFANWSRSKDPNGIAWAFVAGSNRFCPMGEVPPEILATLLSEPPVGLTTGDLAERLKIGPSTLSHKKKEKDIEELVDWTRKKDPDGVGWIFLPEHNRFKPEDNSKGVLQGELLNTEPLDQVNPIAAQRSERSEEG